MMTQNNIMIIIMFIWHLSPVCVMQIIIQQKQ